MKQVLFLFVVLLSAPAFSQEEKDSYALFLERSKETLRADLVVGEWQAADTSGGTIRFEHMGTGLYLVAGNSNSYYFYPKDSLAGFSAIGTIAMWPPQDCYIKYLDENTIEAEFYNYQRNFGVNRFKRVMN